MAHFHSLLSSEDFHGPYFDENGIQYIVLKPPPAAPTGYKPFPQFFMHRQNGTVTPLVALDELPPWIKIGAENWQDPGWLQYMRPASVYQFPWNGVYEVEIQDFCGGDSHPPLTVRAKDANSPRQRFGRATCQSPEPIEMGKASASLATILASAEIGGHLLKCDIDNQTVIHRGDTTESTEGSNSTASMSSECANPIYTPDDSILDTPACHSARSPANSPDLSILVFPPLDGSAAPGISSSDPGATSSDSSAGDPSSPRARSLQGDT
jgi:hypothetical protein